MDSRTSEALTHCLYKGQSGVKLNIWTDDIVNYFMLVSKTYLKTGENIVSRYRINTVVHAEIKINTNSRCAWM